MKKLIREIVGESDTDIPASFFIRMAEIESRLDPKAVSFTGAKGLFQFTLRTWKAYSDGNRFDPRDATEAVIELAEDNKQYLRRKLGRDVEPYEIYMAHNIGMGGAKRLLLAPKDDIVSKALIKSNPAHNPKFFKKGRKFVTVQEAIERYRKEFEA